jgi:hypothetical protein
MTTTAILKWDIIKDEICVFNGNTRNSPATGKPLTNEETIALFINKVHLKYKYEPYIETIFVEIVTRKLDESIDENTNFFIEASKDNFINTTIENLTEIIRTKVDLFNRSLKITHSSIDVIDIDKNMILISALSNLTLEKYKILAKMLYESNDYYLKYAKESIINSNEKLSLDYLLYGFELNNIDKFTNMIKDFVSNKQKLTYLLFFIFIILLIINI